MNRVRRIGFRRMELGEMGQNHPAVHISFSRSLLQVFLGHPLPLCPCAVHCSACLAMLSSFLLNVCPVQASSISFFVFGPALAPDQFFSPQFFDSKQYFADSIYSHVYTAHYFWCMKENSDFQPGQTELVSLVRQSVYPCVYLASYHGTSLAMETIL